MKKEDVSALVVVLMLLFFLQIPQVPVMGQKSSEKSPGLPENVTSIITASCTPCHTSNGGMMSRMRLNFSEWTNYSVETQKTKAAKIYSVLSKGKMPPKAARENRPDIIPTREQQEIIKNWSESFVTEGKK